MGNVLTNVEIYNQSSSKLVYQNEGFYRTLETGGKVFADILSRKLIIRLTDNETNETHVVPSKYPNVLSSSLSYYWSKNNTIYFFDTYLPNIETANFRFAETFSSKTCYLNCRNDSSRDIIFGVYSDVSTLTLTLPSNCRTVQPLHLLFFTMDREIIPCENLKKHFQSVSKYLVDGLILRETIGPKATLLVIEDNPRYNLVCNNNSSTFLNISTQNEDNCIVKSKETKTLSCVKEVYTSAGNSLEYSTLYQGTIQDGLLFALREEDEFTVLDVEDI